MHLCTMAIILCIETSGTICSVALFNESKTCLGFLKEDASFKHAAVATVLIDKLVTASNLVIGDIDAVALSSGPGSYTGLRIGTSVAKGLCYALNITLISINSLTLMASGFIESNDNLDGQLICPAIDARRMEIFTAIYNPDLTCAFTPAPLVVTTESFSELLTENNIHIFGSGAEKSYKEINHPNLQWHVDDFLSARFMGQLAVNKWKAKTFEDTAYFEPDYLKAFHTTAKRK